VCMCVFGCVCMRMQAHLPTVDPVRECVGQSGCDPDFNKLAKQPKRWGMCTHASTLTLAVLDVMCKRVRGSGRMSLIPTSWRACVCVCV
jgi:hypothetical protein